MKVRRVVGLVPEASALAHPSGLLLPDLSGVTESAEQGEDEPAREVARDVPDVGAGDDLDEIVADDLSPWRPRPG
jgi:hypothetical protein